VEEELDYRSGETGVTLFIEDAPYKLPFRQTR